MQNIDLNDRFSKYFITPDYSLFSDSLYFREIEAVLKSNVKILQFRSKNTDPKKINKISNRLYKISSNYECLYIINSFHLDVIEHEISGIHLTSKDLRKEPFTRQKNLIYGASCHNKEEIIISNELKMDYITLSPVYNTNKKKGIGWENFKILAKDSQSPVYALGGINHHRELKRVRKNNGFGVAAISSYLNSDLKNT